MSRDWELEKASRGDQSDFSVSLADLAELSGEGLALVDPVTGFTVMSNGVFRNLFGMLPGEEVACVDFFTQAWAREGWQRILETGSPQTWRPIRAYLKGAQGRCFPALVRIAWVERAKGTLLGIALNDVTEEARMAQAVARGTRLRRLGSLAGYLVHRFNNLLQSMMGATQSIDSPEARNLVDAVEGYGRQATDLSASLLRVLMPEESGRPEVLDGSREWEKIVQLLEKMAVKRKCEIQLDLATGLQVHARSDLFRDLLLDVTHQYISACPEGGIISLGLSRKEVPLHHDWQRGQAIFEWALIGGSEEPTQLSAPRMNEFVAAAMGGVFTPSVNEGKASWLVLPLARD